jgi:protein-tyrosine phosphatase
VFRITQCLSVGPFASPQRAGQLLGAGVTHVLNVSDVASEVSPAHGFAEVAWVPTHDGKRLPRASMIEALNTLHRFASAPGSHVYVHCVAGQLRSPTVLWLYLIALGISRDDAQEWIESRAPDAVAGHHRMVDHEHVLLAQKHGLTHFFPHPRPELVVPFPLESQEAESLRSGLRSA